MADDSTPDTTPDLGQPAVQDDNSLLLLDQHDGDDVDRQVEEIEDDKEKLLEGTLANVSTVDDDAATVAIIAANTAVPLSRRPAKTFTSKDSKSKDAEAERAAAVDDLTIEEKKTPSDLDLSSDPAPEYDESMQQSREAEFAAKEANSPTVASPGLTPTEDDTDGLDASGRWNPQGDASEHPDYVVNEQHYLTVTDEGTFTEIASRLGFGQPSVEGRKIASINGITDGRDYVSQGQKILLPQGYDYQ